MKRTVRSSNQLNARYREKMQRVQEILISRAAVVGAAFARMQAARTAWLESDQQRPFSAYLNDAMSSFAVQP